MAESTEEQKKKEQEELEASDPMLAGIEKSVAKGGSPFSSKDPRGPMISEAMGLKRAKRPSPPPKSEDDPTRVAAREALKAKGKGEEYALGVKPTPLPKVKPPEKEEKEKKEKGKDD